MKWWAALVVAVVALAIVGLVLASRETHPCPTGKHEVLTGAKVIACVT